MNTKLKTLLLSCFLALIVGNAISQEIKRNIPSIDSISEYKVINPEMCKAIDTLFFYVKDCDYFSALNKPYLIWICIYNTSMFSVNAIPYSCTLINWFRADSRTEEEGICSYKNHPIFIQSFVPNYINRLFEPIDKKSNLYYDNSWNILDHIYGVSEGISITFDYKDNKVEMEDELDISLCGNHYYFYYMVQQGDTWSDIAKECGCSEDDLRKEYPEMKTPIFGYLIMVQYIFENKELVGVQRVQ